MLFYNNNFFTVLIMFLYLNYNLILNKNNNKRSLNEEAYGVQGLKNHFFYFTKGKMDFSLKHVV